MKKKPARRYKYTTCRQEGGNDGYCYVIRVNGQERINGLTRHETDYYRLKWENEEREKRGEPLLV